MALTNYEQRTLKYALRDMTTFKLEINFVKDCDLFHCTVSVNITSFRIKLRFLPSVLQMLDNIPMTFKSPISDFVIRDHMACFQCITWKNAEEKQ